MNYKSLVIVVLVGAAFAVARSYFVPAIELSARPAMDAGKRQALENDPALRAAYVRARQRAGGVAYRIIKGGNDRWRADNGKHGFAAMFSAPAVTLRSEAGMLGFRLASMGRGKATTLAPPIFRTHARGARIAYERGTVTEWYVNGPLGLEQGFELARRPTGDGQVVLEIEVTGLVPRQNGANVGFADAAGEQRYTYRDLIVQDVHGTVLPSRMEVSDQLIALRFDDKDAVYPVVVDPIVNVFEAKLVAADRAGGDRFGNTVALSGNTAIIGAFRDDRAELNMGAAYVFVRSGFTWTQQAKLVAADTAADDWFGYSAALDGDTAVITAPQDDDAGDDSGAAYVFVRSGSVWTERAKLVASDGATRTGQRETVLVGQWRCRRTRRSLARTSATTTWALVRAPRTCSWAAAMCAPQNITKI